MAPRGPSGRTPSTRSTPRPTTRLGCGRTDGLRHAPGNRRVTPADREQCSTLSCSGRWKRPVAVLAPRRTRLAHSTRLTPNGSAASTPTTDRYGKHWWSPSPHRATGPYHHRNLPKPLGSDYCPRQQPRTLNRVTHRGSGLTRIDRDGWQQTHPDGQCCTPPADAVTVVSRSVVSVVRTSPSASLTALLLP